LKRFPEVNELPAICQFLIILILAFSVIFMLGSLTESYSKKNDSIHISVINASFIPLTNTNANQVKVNIEYNIEDEKMQNQLINAVMEVYATNGTLIRTTSIGSGFAVQSEGEKVLKTTVHDKSLKTVSIKIFFTDLTKKTALSNVITKNLKLEEDSKNPLKLLL
jgi:hypothetical protein